jgi:hypothetical protein
MKLLIFFIIDSLIRIYIYYNIFKLYHNNEENCKERRFVIPDLFIIFIFILIVVDLVNPDLLANTIIMTVVLTCLNVVITKPS